MELLDCLFDIEALCFINGSEGSWLDHIISNVLNFRVVHFLECFLVRVISSIGLRFHEMDIPTGFHKVVRFAYHNWIELVGEGLKAVCFHFSFADLRDLR